MRQYHRPMGVLLLTGIVVGLVIAIAGALISDSRAADSPDHFTFAVFGDNRPNRANHPQPEVFERILQEIDALDPEFAVNTGDSIFGSGNINRLEEQYDEYLDTLRSNLRAKVYLTLGNHEITNSKANQDFFRDQLGELYYSFDFGNSYFIILNSEIVGETHMITGEQLEWLEDELRKARRSRHKFIFLHRPLFPVGGHIGNCLDKYPEERDALHLLFARNQVTAVFAGHEHLFHQEVRSGVRYVITGGGGALLYPSVQGTGDFHHYIVVSVSGREVEMKVVKPAYDGRPQEVIPIDAG